MIADRFKDAIRLIVAELLPERAYLAPARYTVTSASAGKFSGYPVNAARGLPPASDWPIRGSIAGGHTGTKLKKGTIVLVAFVDGDPSAPIIVGIDDAQEPDALALEAATKASVDAPQVILAGGVLGVARMGDAVVAGPFPGTIVSASVKVKAG